MTKTILLNLSLIIDKFTILLSWSAERTFAMLYVCKALTTHTGVDPLNCI